VAACFAFTLVIASWNRPLKGSYPLLFILLSRLVFFQVSFTPTSINNHSPCLTLSLSLFLLSLSRERERTHTHLAPSSDRPTREREREMRIIWLSCNKFHSSSWAFWELKMVSQWRRRQFTQVLPSKRFRIRHSPAPDNEAIIML